MTITIEERTESRQVVSNQSARFRYIISSDEYISEQEAVEALEDETSETYEFGTGSVATSTLVRQPVSVEELVDSSHLFKFYGEVNYKINSPSPPSGSSSGLQELENFETSGGTVHITQAIDTTDTAGSASDFNDAIGVSNDGGNLTVDGVDIVAPIFNKTINKIFSGSEVTTAYKSILFNLTGKVNNATFKEFNAGECLFLGATGNEQSNGDWNITFNFAGSPNKTNLAVGDSLTVDKKGWEYLWVEYADEKDDTTHRFKKTIKAAYVQQVYETGDFSTLGLS